LIGWFLRELIHLDRGKVVEGNRKLAGPFLLLRCDSQGKINSRGFLKKDSTNLNQFYRPNHVIYYN
jgi:hypothetical protein